MKKLTTFIKKALSILIILFVGFQFVQYINPTFSVDQEFSSIFKTNDYTSEYIYMLDKDTKEVAYEKNEHKKAYPASLTKIMTALVAIENIDDVFEVAPVDVKTYQKMVESNAAMAGFYGYEPVTYRDLLYGTILNSGGEAANSLAINVAGSTEDFVQMMNDKAVELGLEDTQFTNPEGLHDKKQFTTAYDMGKLLNYALDNEYFREVFTKEAFRTTETPDHPDGVLLESTVLSKLDDEMQDGFKIIGGKSGTTYEAGQNWATLGLIEDKEYICIVMGAPLDEVSSPDHAQITDTLELFTNVSIKH